LAEAFQNGPLNADEKRQDIPLIPTSLAKENMGLLEERTKEELKHFLLILRLCDNNPRGSKMSKNPVKKEKVALLGLAY
jgi:hypothetical protein